jgi:membrane protease YdiL (CAAX protease family)
MSAWLRLTDEIGLRRARDYSLGWCYAGAMCIGAAIACVLGIRTLPQTPVTWTLLASLLLWQPFVEELLFRGLLQGALARSKLGARRAAGLSLANVLTSITFVLVHLVNQPVLWALGVFFPSLLFGFFRDRSGSIWPPLLLHMLFNSAFFLPWITTT